MPSIAGRMAPRRLLALAIATGVAFLAPALHGISAAQAAPVLIIAERNTHNPAGQNVFLISYPSFDDLQNGTNASEQSVPLLSTDFSSDFDLAGFSTVGGSIRLLAERNTHNPAGQNVFLISYPTFGDFLNGTNASEQSVPLLSTDFSPDFNIAGFDVPPDANAVPEPGPLAALLVGLAGVGLARWRATASRAADGGACMPS